MIINNTKGINNIDIQNRHLSLHVSEKKTFRDNTNIPLNKIIKAKKSILRNLSINLSLFRFMKCTTMNVKEDVIKRNNIFSFMFKLVCKMKTIVIRSTRNAIRYLFNFLNLINFKGQVSI